MDNQPAPTNIENSQAGSLRVMTYNIRNSGALDGPNRWAMRRDLWTATVRAFSPDLLGVQEVLADQYDYLKAAFPEYGLSGVARDDGNRAGEWSLILYRLSRFERLDEGNLWLSQTPDAVGSKSWDAALPRICSWVRLRDRLTSHPMLFANAHFDHAGEQSRIESARLLAERLPQLAGNQSALLTGDFNCTEMDEPYAVLTPSIFRDSYRIVHPTPAADEASFNDFKGITAGWRIDWILHTKDLNPTSATIDCSNLNGRYPSDHYAVTTVLARS